MKTLGIIAVIWVLYSIYREYIRDDVTTNMWYFGIGDFIKLSATWGILLILAGIIYLIITYLP